MAKNTRLTSKLDYLRPRTVGAIAKQLASNSDKSSTRSSSGGKNEDKMKKMRII
jgi:hypothetical protein